MTHDVVIVTLVVFTSWFVQNCLHEGSHLLFAYLLRGWKPREFCPYPHKHNGRWYFARCRYTRPIRQPIPEWIHIAPAIAGWWWGCTWSIIASVTWWFGGYGWYLAFIPAGMGFFEIVWFWIGYMWGSDMSDGKRFRKTSGL